LGESATLTLPDYGRIARYPPLDLRFGRELNIRPGYRDIADSNKAFALFKIKNLLPPDASKLISILQPGHDEIVVDKDRFCAFSGNDLK
jgi:hypothetical protein